MLQQMLEPHPQDAKYQAEVEELGQKMTFTALMRSASQAWGAKGHGHNRLLGPSKLSVTSLLSKVQAALK